MPNVWTKLRLVRKQLGKEATFEDAIKAKLLTEEEALYILKSQIHDKPKVDNNRSYAGFILGLLCGGW